MSNAQESTAAAPAAAPSAASAPSEAPTDVDLSNIPILGVEADILASHATRLTKERIVELRDVYLRDHHQMLQLCNKNKDRTVLTMDEADVWDMISLKFKMAKTLIRAQCYGEAYEALKSLSALYISVSVRDEKKREALPLYMLFPDDVMILYLVYCCQCVYFYLEAIRFASAMASRTPVDVQSKKKKKRRSQQKKQQKQPKKTKEAGKDEDKDKTGAAENEDDDDEKTPVTETQCKWWAKYVTVLKDSMLPVSDQQASAIQKSNPNLTEDEIAAAVKSNLSMGFWRFSHVLSVDDYSEGDVKPVDKTVDAMNKLPTVFVGEHLEVRKSPVHGYGLFVKGRDFPAGAVIGKFRPIFFSTISNEQCGSCGKLIDLSKFDVEEVKDEKTKSTKVVVKDYKDARVCDGPCRKAEIYCSQACIDRAKHVYHDHMCKPTNRLLEAVKSVRLTGSSGSSRQDFMIAKMFARYLRLSSTPSTDPLLCHMMKTAESLLEDPGSTRGSVLHPLSREVEQYGRCMTLAQISSMRPDFDFRTYCLLSEVVAIYGVTGGPKNHLGVDNHIGIYNGAMFVNHCCNPNARANCDANDKESVHLTLTAEKDIKDGEEIFINYLGQKNLNETERTQDLRDFGVHCRCALCLVQREMPLEEQMDISMKAIVVIGADRIRKREEAEAAAAAAAAASEQKQKEEQETQGSPTENKAGGASSSSVPSTECVPADVRGVNSGGDGSAHDPAV